jgi:hypothetical protein
MISMYFLFLISYTLIYNYLKVHVDLGSGDGRMNFHAR